MTRARDFRRWLRRAQCLLLVCVASLAVNAAGQEVCPSADSIYAHIRHLSETIGPRPMGSPAEQAALRWAVATFRRLGADSAYLMPFRKVPQASPHLNTTSGNAVALFRGTSDSLIIIGGHIDSAGPEVPGANDDASGVATVLELARVWKDRPRRYTMLFVAFGGEERGLLGSTFFAEHFRDLPKAMLMLSLDMTGADGPIVPMFETRKAQAPEWLVRDAFAADATLGHDLLFYPTHFTTLNSLGKGAGSDHEPFLSKNVPAIDFTVGLNTSPIHTPHDNILAIRKDKLAQYARFVDSLLLRYQSQGVPSANSPRFMLWQVRGRLLFVPWWAVTAVVVGALVLAPVSLFVARRARLRLPRQRRSRLTSLKLLVLWVFVVLCAQAGEALLQEILGLRHPWVVHVWAYVGYAGVWAVAGLWLALQTTRVWRFSQDPYVYSRFALIFLAVMTAVLMPLSTRLAFYPAMALLLLALAVLVPLPPLRAALCLAAPLPLFRLLLMEALPMGARLFAHSAYAVDTFWRSFAMTTLLSALLVGWLAPVLFILGYMVRAIPGLSLVLKSVRRVGFGAVPLAAVVGYGFVLSRLPAYNEIWRPMVRVTAEYRLPAKRSALHLASDEYLRGVKLQADTVSRYYAGRVHSDSLVVPFAADWLTIEGRESVRPGVSDTVTVDWRFSFAHPPYNLAVNITADSGRVDTVVSDLAFRKGKRGLFFSWSAWPSSPVDLRATLVLRGASMLVRRVTATYTELPLLIAITAPEADVISRTRVTHTDTLRLARTSATGGR
ncbi:MAG: M28 family peptidase [Calditrichaeota bacterium]|nr:M28 family peptidase [Calditrichota bacterium]